MRVLVCGGRDYADREKVYRALDTLDQKVGITIIATGDATGADALAKEWAKLRHIPGRHYPADWKLGKKAGPIRNRKMLIEFQPELVVAFSGGAGTADCVRQARARGIEVREIE